MPRAKHLAVFPGSFDPITNGHVDIIRRALRICDKLIIGVAINIGKDPLFDLKERVELVDETLAQINGASQNGRVAESRPFSNLLMHFVEDRARAGGVPPNSRWRPECPRKRTRSCVC